MTGLPADHPALRAPLVLASASPRRQEILRLAGVPFVSAASAAEAEAQVQERPPEQAVHNALVKALDVAAGHPDALVVGADTVVALGRKVLGKPADAAEAEAMLRQLSGRSHRVYTGFVIVAGAPAETLTSEVVASAVTFRTLPAATISAYVASGDPLDKAGAYGIQSGGGALVAEVVGSYLNVVGLPLARLLRALASLGWTGPVERPDEN